jgi:hypothetical protein
VFAAFHVFTTGRPFFSAFTVFAASRFLIRAFGILTTLAGLGLAAFRICRAAFCIPGTTISFHLRAMTCIFCNQSAIQKSYENNNEKNKKTSFHLSSPPISFKQRRCHADLRR